MDKKNLMVKGASSQGLFGATLGFFFGFGSVALFGPTANLLKDLMGLSPLQVGFLVSAPALSGSLLRIPFAAWVDTTGGRKPFLVLLVLSVLGMVGLLSVILTCYPDRMTSEIYPLLLILGVLCGCGIATFSVGIGQVSYWFPQKEQGTALGSFAGYGNLAPGMFTFLLPIALSSLGLAGSYFAWLIFLIIGVVLYFKFGLNAWYFQLIEKGLSKEKALETAQRRYGQEIFPQGKLADSLIISARCWKTWVLVFIYFTTFGGFIALTAWFPVYWKAVFNFSVFKASLFAAIFSI
ncbi:Nitrate/nitrite transporter NarK, partial [hydrothermal vent metagenome]